jgi:uncharacterized protein involved in exopolysaccharide biosynthesis
MMDSRIIYLSDYTAILKRRKWDFLTPLILISVAAVSFAFTLPSRFQSTGTILIEQQEIPSDLVRSTVTSYADQRVEIVRQRTMTTQNLGAIVERHDLYSDLRNAKGMASAIEALRSNIDIKTISADIVDPRSGRSGTATIAFSISYVAASPALSQRVANDVISLFLNENLRDRKRAAEEASRFLQDESTKLSERVSHLEEQLARFKEQHGDSIPEMMQLNLQVLQKTEDSIAHIEQEIRALEATQIHVQSQLETLSPYSALYNRTGERILSPKDRLKALETDIITARSRYSEDHPDRIALERELEVLRREVGRQDSADLKAMLKEQQDRLNSLRAKYSDEHPNVKQLQTQIAETNALIRAGGSTRQNTTDQLRVTDADDPSYVRLQSEFAANQAKLDALNRTKQELTLKLNSLEQRISDAPKVEREYRMLSRDYESAVQTYNEIRTKHLEATLAESLETERKSERFTLVEPPLVPEQPYSPNRPAIVLVGLVLALGSGSATVAVREAMAGGIFSITAIKELTGAPPLAVIPRILTSEDRRRSRRRRVIIAFIVMAVVTVILVAVHLTITPLDLLWYNILQRLGIDLPT